MKTWVKGELVKEAVASLTTLVGFRSFILSSEYRAATTASRNAPTWQDFDPAVKTLTQYIAHVLLKEKRLIWLTFFWPSWCRDLLHSPAFRQAGNCMHAKSHCNSARTTFRCSVCLACPLWELSLLKMNWPFAMIFHAPFLALLPWWLQSKVRLLTLPHFCRDDHVCQKPCF